MKNLIFYPTLLVLLFSRPVQGQEKIVQMPPKGDPALIAASKALIKLEFTNDVDISVLSAEPFNNDSWDALFPNSSPATVDVVIMYPETNHGTVISFLVSSLKDKYVINRSMEPSGFLKALKSHKKRVDSPQDAERIARAFAALCRLNLSGKIEAQQSVEGYTVSLPTQSGQGEAMKLIKIELELFVDSESRLVSEAKAVCRVLTDSEKKE